MATVDPTTYELDFTAETGSHLDAVLNIEGFTISGPKAHTNLPLYDANCDHDPNPSSNPNLNFNVNLPLELTPIQQSTASACS